MQYLVEWGYVDWVGWFECGRLDRVDWYRIVSCFE